MLTQLIAAQFVPVSFNAVGASGAGALRLDARLRVLVVDADAARARASAAMIEHAGAREPATALHGDEALDVLGAAAQQFDVVAAFMPLPDEADVDMVGVLRRCRSPVKLLVVTDLRPDTYPRPGRLAGATSVLDPGSYRSLAAAIHEAHEHGSSFAEIVASRTVPDILPRRWAERIHGAGPGQQFHSDLD